MDDQLRTYKIFGEEHREMKKGFTLIELLVVIAIIALLLSIILPSLSKVKDVAAMKLCGNNARQIMMASMAYAADNDDEVPRSTTNYRNEGTTPLIDKNNDSWVCLPVRNPALTPATTDDFIDPRNGATLEQRLAGIRHGTMFPYLENTDVYHCPKDDRQRKYGQGFRTYSLSQMAFDGTKQQSALAKWGPVAKRVSDVSSPGSRMAVVEQADPRGQFNWGGFVYASYGKLGGIGWEEPLANWHKGGFMYACFDGHVEQYQIIERATNVYIEECRERYNDWFYYSQSKAAAITPASANRDIYNLTRLLDVFGFTKDWAWTIN